MMFGIPSYKRPECKTVDTLLSLGIPAKDIRVGLQDWTQLDDYVAVHPQIQYIVKSADCAAGNRNTLIDALEKPLILLDDDVTSFAVKKPGHNFKTEKDGTALLRMYEEMIAVAEENHCGIIGCSPTTNDIIAKRRPEYSFDCLLQGTFLIILGEIRFNDKWKMVEDYEICLRYIRRGGHTLRANRLACNKPQNGSNDGGLHERYANHELPAWINRLSAIYPEFKANKERTGGYLKF